MHRAIWLLSVYRFIGLLGFWFIDISGYLGYQFIGSSDYWAIGISVSLSLFGASGYRFIRLSVYRVIGLLGMDFSHKDS